MIFTYYKELNYMQEQDCKERILTVASGSALSSMSRKTDD